MTVFLDVLMIHCCLVYFLFISHRFLQAVDQKVAQLKESINSNRQGQPHEVIDR